MALVKVMNPPRRRKHKRKMAKVLKRKNPVHKKRKRVHRRKRHILRHKAVRRHHAKKRHAKVKRHRKRRVKKVSHRRRHRRSRKHLNPFGGELIMLGNPGKHSRKRRKKYMARHRKRHRRRHYALSNPLSVKGLLSRPKEMFTKDFAMDALGISVGLVGSNMALGYLPVSFRDNQIKLLASKIGVIVGLSAVVGTFSPKMSRMVLAGGGASILLDLYAKWQAGRAAPAAPGGTSAYYGDPGTGAYYGDQGMGDDIVLSDSE